MATIVELEADVGEIKSMLREAKRPNVRKELERALTSTESDLKRLREASAVTDKDGSVIAAAAESKPVPAEVPPPAARASTVSVRSAGPWTEITTFALDLGGYDKPLVTVDIRMKGVEALPAEAVTCDFTESSFDLKVIGFEGANHRMVKTNLDKDIVPAESSVRVKKNHVIVTLQKVKGKYGYDSWTDLCAKGGKRRTTTKSENPQDGIMGMMKDMYDDGDDNMKKIIGEAMLKAKTGEKYEPSTDDLKMPGDGLDDL
eukprot:TRINITY_DN334_c0_g1_i5.p1 TRINITY_DN334_c0_g1~~TRINITY_DN334_c0_g1_i5.p1  ORF type:complete len:280 (-),score=56.16 TRINITY_DN334_c0_g1_i5:171-947(-)